MSWFTSMFCKCCSTNKQKINLNLDAVVSDQLELFCETCEKEIVLQLNDTLAAFLSRCQRDEPIEVAYQKALEEQGLPHFLYRDYGFEQVEYVCLDYYNKVYSY